jgi:hypothetical protein
MEAACGAMMKGKEGACGEMTKPAIVAPTPAPVVAPAAVAAPAKPAVAPAPATVAPAKPAAPAAARATSNKVVEGQCAAVKEETHDAPKQDASKKANAPWGNRKKIVNP